MITVSGTEGQKAHPCSVGSAGLSKPPSALTAPLAPTVPSYGQMILMPYSDVTVGVSIGRQAHSDDAGNFCGGDLHDPFSR